MGPAAFVSRKLSIPRSLAKNSVPGGGTVAVCPRGCGRLGLLWTPALICIQVGQHVLLASTAEVYVCMSNCSESADWLLLNGARMLNA